MDSEYQKWWQIHVRVARGESLTHDEQALYSAGVDKFDREESEQNHFSQVEELQRTIAAQEQYIAALQAQIEQFRSDQ